jgi:hypothetical protein
MSKPRQLENLSREELISLIHNNIPLINIRDSYCVCSTCCGNFEIENKLSFVCDECDRKRYEWPTTLETNYFGE